MKEKSFRLGRRIGVCLWHSEWNSGSIGIGWLNQSVEFSFTLACVVFIVTIWFRKKGF